MAEFRVTSADHIERMNESQWCSPFHLTSFEVETKHGVHRRYAPGIRTAGVFNAHVLGRLKDSDIDKYVRQGYYEGQSQRHQPALKL